MNLSVTGLAFDDGPNADAGDTLLLELVIPGEREVWRAVGRVIRRWPIPAEELDAAVDEWCKRLLELSPQALRVAKLSLNFESDQLWPSVLHGYQMISFIHGTDEFHEGTRAFLEKRKADFSPFR